MSEEPMIVRRTPPVTALPPALPLEPERRNHVEVEIVGGPHHGQRVKVWDDVKTLRLPVVTEAETPEAPEIQTAEDGKAVQHEEGHYIVPVARRSVVQSTAIYAVYTRASKDSLTASFTDYSLDD